MVSVRGIKRVDVRNSVLVCAEAFACVCQTYLLKREVSILWA
jgi:hypothetical protein